MTTVTTTATTTTAAQPKAASTIASDFDTFLKLLTTQMTNQDPMNPTDSTAFATQLATFSGVEQQTRTNALLESLSGQFNVMSMSQLAGWVGQQARTDAAVWVTGAPVTLDVTPAATADRAVLVVSDAAGNTVAREEINPQATRLDWLPQDAAGGALPEGAYTLTLESWNGETKLGISPVQSFAPITEARISGTDTVLVLQGGVEVSSSRITALRAG